MENMEKKLKRIENEDIIWCIYFFIIGFNLYSDYLEKEYVLTKNPEAHKLYKTINIGILIVAIFIYLYFVYISYNDYQNAKTNKNKFYANLALLASILFLLGGAITLYVVYNSKSEDEEEAIL